VRVDVAGWTAPGFDRVREAFAANFVERGEVGAAFSAYVDGDKVVDVWGGLADRRNAVRWEEDTLVGVFSGSKGLVGTCMLMLVERGRLDLDAPVAEYWPEFAAHGKGGVTVGDALTHRAGVPGLATPVSIEEATDGARMAALVAAQAPTSAPSDGPRYHAVNFGWICGELVRRVDGRSLGEFLQEEVAKPLGLDAWIGLPAACDRRVAVLERAAAFGEEQEEVADDPLAWSIWSNPPRLSGDEVAGNLRVWRAAEVPGTNGIVAPRSLARLYGCLALGGEIDGVRLLSAETIETARKRVARGRDPYLGEVAFATGFQAQVPAMMELGPPLDAFGYAGAGGSVHGAWPSLMTGFSYAPNLLGTLTTVDPRSKGLLDALHGSVVEYRRGRKEAASYRSV